MAFDFAENENLELKSCRDLLELAKTDPAQAIGLAYIRGYQTAMMRVSGAGQYASQRKRDAARKVGRACGGRKKGCKDTKPRIRRTKAEIEASKTQENKT